MLKKSDSFVSVVLVTENDASRIEAVVRGLQQYLAQHFVDYEIVVVDQRSQDGTAKVVESLLTTVSGVRFIQLAYKVAQDVAIAAGMENAIGDFVVIFSARNDPIDCVLDLVKRCKAGADIVVGVAPQRTSLAYSLVRPWIRRLLRNIGYDLPRNATHLRCLSRRTVNAVTSAGRFHHQFFVRIQKTGYPSAAFEYRQLERSDVRTLAKGLHDAARLLVFNSTRPLRWMSGLGMAGSGLAAAGALYGVAASLFTRGEWARVPLAVLFVSLLFMILFTMLAFFGEYLGRLLDDRGEQHLYSVVSEKNSSVMLNENRVNVLTESTSPELSMVATGRRA